MKTQNCKVGSVQPRQVVGSGPRLSSVTVLPRDSRTFTFSGPPICTLIYPAQPEGKGPLDSLFQGEPRLHEPESASALQEPRALPTEESSRAFQKAPATQKSGGIAGSD